MSGEDDSRRLPNSYPSVFPVSLSHSAFPSDGSLYAHFSYTCSFLLTLISDHYVHELNFMNAATSMDKAGLPFGCTINLFIQKADRTEK